MVARSGSPPDLPVRPAATDLASWWQAIWDSSPVGLFIADRGGACLFTNARFRGIAGLAEGSALGHGWAANLHPDDRDSVLSGWETSALAGQAFVDSGQGHVHLLVNQSVTENVEF